jgi:hydroxyethylthiazole kinase
MMPSVSARLDEIAAVIDRVRRDQPLVHIISNFVTMGDVANAALAVGARPVMAHAPDEIEEITRAARALVLNLGTPSRERIEAMILAGKAANARGIPILLDPVGVGASSFRKESAARILGSLRIAIVRGNAGEIGALAGIAGTQSGVDTARADYDRARVGKSLAEKYHAVIAITGATDFVSDGTHVAAVENGDSLLKQITGTGDMLDAIIGACAAVESEVMVAAASGLLWFGIAAERAARSTSARGIGSFRVALLDALGNLNADAIQRNAKFNWISGG